MILGLLAAPAIACTGSDGDDDGTSWACSREFAAGFAELYLDFGPLSSAGFSSDCSRLFTIDREQTLRVTDLLSGVTDEISTAVYDARFTADPSSLLYHSIEEPDWIHDLYLARGSTSYLIDHNVGGKYQLSSDGSRVAYSVTESNDTKLRMFAIERPEAPPFTIASGLLGAPVFTPDGSRIVYFANEAMSGDENECAWVTADLYVFNVTAGVPFPRFLTDELLPSSMLASSDGRRVYAARNFDCENRTQSLVSVDLASGGTTVLRQEVTAHYPIDYMVEEPTAGLLLHPIENREEADYSYTDTLLATATDGSQSRTLAEDMAHYDPFIMGLVPFRLVRPDRLLYVRADGGELVSVDLPSNTTTDLTGVRGAQGYRPSPDGELVLSLASDEWPLYDVRLTPTAGGVSQLLTEQLADPYDLVWTASGERILLATAEPESGNAELLAFDTAGQSQVLSNDFHAEYPYPGITVHPDGWLVAYSSSDGVVVAGIPRVED